ncbi:unnamed protein product [Didymodactylos carnosus]|uniref:Uncharacterized protein n=1 Tax=Didymodactylos carnosus TaxID=1234261 RepID=A0A815XU04_9BILA|nr:unnamed protein product [Didymodactylos carnosus]CAF1562453.1 unnamed protein product [Didymodactylos carnosus]CAF3844875.1 unnamed protein product [Didymodactylos carnosus]CAF4423998.1 unnamed protein product [Didymodactylos carnosus]
MTDKVRQSENELELDLSKKVQQQELELKFDVQENDQLEHYNRRTNLRIFGVEEEKGEDTNQIVLYLAEVLDIPVFEEDIPGRTKFVNQSKRPNFLH